VSGLPETEFDVWCLVARQRFFQLELFEFKRPRIRPVRADWQPSDIGYSMFGIHVADFDATLERIARVGGVLLSDPAGPLGQRHVCLFDPDQVLLELLEDDVAQHARPASERDAGTAVRSITLSVPDLHRARRFWRDTLGLVEMPNVALRTDECAPIWDGASADSERAVLWSGDFAVELVQWKVRARNRPAGYLLSDQGIVNVAFGTLDKNEFREMYKRVIGAGYTANTEPWVAPGLATVVYLNDDQGFSVELLCVEPDALETMGFEAARDST
jgi:catechol 2,3-dioxygenase-like lactoylglutathione lyase family enzyme